MGGTPHDIYGLENTANDATESGTLLRTRLLHRSRLATGSRTRIRLVGPRGEDSELTWEYGYRWVLLPNSRQVIYEYVHGMSDGPHYNVVLMDPATGRLGRRKESRLIGVSPDGRHIALANRDWWSKGPYKRGGRRVGALRIVSLKTGRERAITGELVSIEGGDWRHPAPTKGGGTR